MCGGKSAAGMCRGGYRGARLAPWRGVMADPGGAGRPHKTRKLIPLNNNNRNNNRRRGRNNRGGQGGSKQGNRIDTRQRSHATQMLEKYKMQFAEQFFGVFADCRGLGEEEPPLNRARGNEREQDDYGSDYENEFEGA